MGSSFFNVLHVNIFKIIAQKLVVFLPPKTDTLSYFCIAVIVIYVFCFLVKDRPRKIEVIPAMEMHDYKNKLVNKSRTYHQPIPAYQLDKDKNANDNDVANYYNDYFAEIAPPQKLIRKQSDRNYKFKVGSSKGGALNERYIKAILANDREANLQQAAFLINLQKQEVSDEIKKLKEVTSTGLKSMFAKAVAKQQKFMADVQGKPFNNEDSNLQIHEQFYNEPIKIQQPQFRLQQILYPSLDELESQYRNQRLISLPNQNDLRTGYLAGVDLTDQFDNTRTRKNNIRENNENDISSDHQDNSYGEYNDMDDDDDDDYDETVTEEGHSESRSPDDDNSE